MYFLPLPHGHRSLRAARSAGAAASPGRARSVWTSESRSLAPGARAAISGADHLEGDDRRARQRRQRLAEPLPIRGQLGERAGCGIARGAAEPEHAGNDDPRSCEGPPEVLDRTLGRERRRCGRAF